MPQKSLLPMFANWLAPVVRGLFAMVPPPPPAGPCPGIPASYTGGGQLVCAPCPYDVSRLCSFVDTNGDGVIDPGEPAPANLIPLPASPNFMRGFDDPQADPDFSLVFLQSVEIRYVRGDLYDLPPQFVSNDSANGNPPWGSCPGLSLGCAAAPDNDADGRVDSSTLGDRSNQGSYSAIGDKDRPRPYGQVPSDAMAGPSCPLGIIGCDPYIQDCGGLAHFNTFKGFPGTAPNALGPPDVANPAVYPNNPPASPEDWPIVPFRREWLGTDYPGGNSPETSIKRLLRFTSSIVSYDSAAPASTAYRLEEDAKEVAVTAACTPLAGALLDAYNYFVNSVFPAPTDSGPPDPAIDCRNYIIVLITDGHDEAGSDPCVGGSSGGGPAGDLGAVALPESAPGRRLAAQALDPSVRVTGIPVYVVGMNSNPLFFPALNCIADNSGGQLFAAGDRTALLSALESLLDFKRSANYFASPSLPAFAGGFGDTAQIGAVVPSHLNENGDLSSWSIWSGTVKSYQLDSNGQIPVVTAAPATVTPTPTSGGPTATPVAATPTPTPITVANSYPDETDPDNASQALRKPVWSAGRVLGYTDPVANLPANAVASGAAPAARAPSISVWPGRKMIFSRSSSGVPLNRADFLPGTGTCGGVGAAGSCFSDLMTDMGLNYTSVADQTLARKTVQFLRGGVTAFGRRDEILNDPSIRPATIGTIGPAAGEEQRYSYFYQDDAPAPGDPPQVRSDDDGAPPAGYAHKLGDIFHSELVMLEPPRYFQYLSANLQPRTSSSTTGQPYLDFANLQAKRRKVLFAGANDGFLHAFDAGVFNRDTTNFNQTHDLGTGREIFAYSPTSLLADKFTNLLNFPPLPQYFVDGSAATADVFIDPAFTGIPDETERVWRTVLVGSLRQGGEGYYALDVTQPDDIQTNPASPNFGEITGNKDASPGCLDGSGSSCTAGVASNREYPTVMWVFSDSGAACSDACGSVGAALGETWSRPVVGRIQVYDPASPTADAAGFDDRYVAIFGGGYDPSFNLGDDVSARLGAGAVIRGRAFYMVDVETGAILYKMTRGVDGGGSPIDFAPMAAPPAVADYNDDGYLDVAYIGDVNGNMWRIDLTPDPAASPRRGEVSGGQLHGYEPFLLFDGCETSGTTCANLRPIFFEPGVVFVGGSGSPPVLGIAFGTGDRAELARPNIQTQDFFYIVDSGQTSTSFVKADLHDLTPPSGSICPVPYTGPCANAANGFVLDYGSNNEKTTSTVFSTQGYLSVVTFTPDSVSPCATNGSSYRYRFFFLTGQGYFGTTGTYGDYRESLGEGFAAVSQSVSPEGDIIDTVLFSGGAIRQDVTPGSVDVIEQNWKEQQ
jgi:hypothetical protein